MRSCTMAESTTRRRIPGGSGCGLFRRRSSSVLQEGQDGQTEKRMKCRANFQYFSVCYFSPSSLRQNIGMYVLVKSIKIKANQNKKYANKVANLLFKGLARSGWFEKKSLSKQTRTSSLNYESPSENTPKMSHLHFVTEETGVSFPRLRQRSAVRTNRLLSHDMKKTIISHSPRQHMGANEDLGHFSVALPVLVTSSQSLDASWPHAGVSHSGCNHFDERHEHDLCGLTLPKHQATPRDAVVFPSHNSCTSGMLQVWTFSWIESVFSGFGASSLCSH